MSTRPVDDVLELFAMKGDECYGEAISQRHHALQCAVVVQEAGSADELVAAALLHDIGHLVADREFGARSDMSLEDDRHEAVGARWVARRFGPQVARPIALHVVAKRYRCTVDPLYYDALSPTSKATLQAQGGRLAPDAVRRFEADPGSRQRSSFATRTKPARTPTPRHHPWRTSCLSSIASRARGGSGRNRQPRLPFTICERRRRAARAPGSSPHAPSVPQRAGRCGKHGRSATDFDLPLCVLAPG